MADFFLDFTQKLCDIAFSLIPQKLINNITPQIIAHRGAHGPSIKENTMAAFLPCLENNIWGIEFDIRWTLDNIPVVHHDSHCGRIFARKDLVINKLSAEDLSKEIPEIPLLSEIINHFGKKLHLMIELKSPPTAEQETILTETLSSLEPAADYHLLSLNTKNLDPITKFPSKCFVAVDEFNNPELTEHCLENNWGGLAKHYLLLSNQQIAQHHSQKQNVGAGYIASKNSLNRELNRSVDWIFTNNALKVNSFSDFF